MSEDNHKFLKIVVLKPGSFADDSQGRKTFPLIFQYNVLKNDISKYMEDIQTYLKINPDKTELLLLYPQTLENQVIIRGTILGGQLYTFL